MSTPTDPRLHRLKRALPMFEQKVRVRVGALIADDPVRPSGVVLVEHDGIWSDKPFWTAPGGGVDYGESLEEALVREVQEETGLDVEVGALRYTLDFVRAPLHAVSFYFQCTVPGRLPEAFHPGTDPEHGDDQLIQSVRLVPFADLSGMNIYPEGFAERLPRDLRAGFPDGTNYLGTLR